MSTPLICDIHGEDFATIVCAHIIDTLRDRQKRGFLWSIDEDGEYQAVCESCRSLSNDDWKNVSDAIGRVLCLTCFKDAAALNGIAATELEGGHA